MSYLLCFGFGYTANVLANRLKQGRGKYRIIGTTQSLGCNVIPDSRNISIVQFNRSYPLDKALFHGMTHVLISIPPDNSGDPVLDMHSTTLSKATPVWIGYLSTVGVYGDTGGAYVDETAKTNPGLPRTIARVTAEQGWLKLWRDHGLPVHLFRIAGIYGPGRSIIDTLIQNRAHCIVKPNLMLSRIHVEDLVTVLISSMREPNPGAIYNVCDDEPASPQDVIAYAAALLERDLPPKMTWREAQDVLSSKEISFYTENRRICNRRIKHDLGVTLRYPSYREGLKQVYITYYHSKDN